jgi:hypothetical protein
MTYAHPWALWFLGLSLPIVALHLYRGRRRLMAVPYLRLWESSFQEAPQRTAFGWPRHLIALALSLALLALLAFALAGPGEAPAGSAAPDKPPAPLAVVLDATLSLRAREPAGRRFDLARAEADRLVRAARGPARVFCAGRGVEAVLDVPADRAAWSRWLADRAPDAPAGTLVPAIESAARWLRAQGGGDGGRLVVITDGATRDEPWLAEALKAAEAKVVRCGTAQPNLALVEGGATRAWGEREAEVFFTVRNFSNAPRPCTLAATLDEHPTRNFTLQLAAGGAESVTFRLAAEGESRLTLRLQVNDALPDDNVLRIVIPPLRRPRVWVFQTAGGNVFLRRALSVFGDRIDAAGSGFAPPHRWEEIAPSLRPEDVVIFDACGPTHDLRPAGYLFLRGRGPFFPAAGKEAESPGAFAWRRGRPARDLPDVAGLKVKSAIAFRVERGMETLLDSDAGPVGVTGEGPAPGIRFIALGFRLEESNFPLLAAFPVFLRNAFDYLTGDAVRHFPAAVAIGEPLASLRPLPRECGAEAALSRWREGDPPASELVPAAPPGAKSTPVSPAFLPRRIPIRDGRIVAEAPAEPGYYRIEAGPVREWLAVNFANAGESDVRPVDLPGAEPPGGAATPAAALGRGWPASAVLVAAALALLAVEWWLFQRGWI